MRTLVVLMLLCAVGAVPAAQPPAEPAGEKRGPSVDADLEMLVTDAVANRGEKGERAAAMLVAMGPRAVPALTQGLWGETSSRKVCAALLVRIGADARAATPSLVRLLRDSDHEVRFAAARALSAARAHAAVPALTRALGDENPEVRLAAAAALVELGASAEVVLPAVLKALKSGGAEVPRAVRLLGWLGPEAAPAVPALADLLADADPFLIADIAYTLGAIGPGARAALPALKGTLRDDANTVSYQISAALALWRVARDPDAPAHLRMALAEWNELTVPQDPLWRIDRSKETVAALEKQLTGDHAGKVLWAARAVGTASKETVPALVKLLDRGDPVRTSAVEALGELGPGAVAALEPLQKLARRARTPELTLALYRIAPTPERARALTDLLEDRALAPRAAEWLKDLRPDSPAVALELVAALDGPDPFVRLPAAVALWRIERHPKALPAVSKLLRDQPAVRELAAYDLGAEFGPGAADAVPELARRLFDPYALVRFRAVQALGRIGPGARAAVPPLLALLDSDEPGFVLAAACDALGLIAPPADRAEVVTALKAKLGHQEIVVRVLSALALVRIADDRAGIKQLEEGFGCRAPSVRVAAAEGLWRVNKDARAVPFLVRALEDTNLEGRPDESERCGIVEALGRIGADAKPAVPELVRLLKHRDHALAAAARAALKAIDPQAAKAAGVK